jgi:hypothetical protein
VWPSAGPSALSESAAQDAWPGVAPEIDRFGDRAFNRTAAKHKWYARCVKAGVRAAGRGMWPASQSSGLENPRHVPCVLLRTAHVCLCTRTMPTPHAATSRTPGWLRRRTPTTIAATTRCCITACLPLQTCASVFGAGWGLAPGPQAHVHAVLGCTPPATCSRQQPPLPVTPHSPTQRSKAAPIPMRLQEMTPVGYTVRCGLQDRGGAGGGRCWLAEWLFGAHGHGHAWRAHTLTQ